MKRQLLFILSLLPAILFAQVNFSEDVITKDLFDRMEQVSENDLIDINIRLNGQYPMDMLYPTLMIIDKDARRQMVISELKTFSNESQKSLVEYLNIQSKSNDAEILHTFWITNVITCKATKEVIYDMSSRSDIANIDWNERRVLIESVPDPIPPGVSDPNEKEITYNVLKVNANDVWGLGYYGEGVIVSVIDTGVNYNHADLSDHMWEDPDYPYHGYDFANNDNNPIDDYGHGSHCAGTIAGDGTAGSQTGMAPEATIMALKVLDSGGGGTESGVWQAIEFTVEHGGDIISMSLGWQHSWNPNRPTWRNTMNNALAAGVVASVAAGNEGGSTSNPDDVRTPGDCPPPWLHPDQTLIGGISAVVCVGATTSNDGIASFSSRGPSSWENINPFNDYPHNPELGLLRPDVSAPGVDIKSCRYNNNTGYTYMSGTSMATPCVAGVMALIMSKYLDMTPEQMSMTLEMTSVDLGSPGKDNVFGTGRVDALEAINFEGFTGADAGADTETCGGELVVLDGSAQNYNSIEWTTSGDGSFDNTTILDPEYTPGSSDITNGEVTLSLTAYGDNGNITDDLLLTINALPELEVSEISGVCYGEAANITFDMIGNAPWTVTFDDATTMEITDTPYEFEISPESTTSYTITNIADATCESEVNIVYTVEVFELPTLEVSGDLTICTGEAANITFDMVGSAPWTVTFDDATTMEITDTPYQFEVSPTSTSTYAITHIMDATCENELSINYSVEVFEYSTVDLGNDTSLCMNYTIELDAGNPGSTYLWSTGDETQTIVVNSDGIDAEGNKTISVDVTNTNDCTTTDEIILNFYACTGINEVSLISDFKVFPNPNNGSFTISMNALIDQYAKIKLVNPMGSVIYSEEIRITKGNFSKFINLPVVAKNLYYLLIETNEGVVSKRIAIIQ